MRFPKIGIDPYVTAILIAVAMGSIAPVSGEAARLFSLATKFAVALLFFLYGARLAREAVISGLVRWRLHLLTLAITFAVFPVISFVWPALPAWLLAPPLVGGMIYLCCLPSTIQSSVALIASARGDVAAGVCAASASSLVGVVITPLLVGLLMHAQGATISPKAIEGIFIQLLLPFLFGQALHPRLGPMLAAIKGRLVYYDRLTIMMIVYGAFSAAVIGGVWKQVSWGQLAILAALCLVLLAVILAVCVGASRLLGFATEDEIVTTFVGAQKSLAAGAPMATLLFPPAQVGLILLPLMLYHPMQLIACAVMAGRYAKRGEPDRSAP